MVHHHVPMEALQRQIRAGVALQGFAIRHVLSDGKQSEFTYTVGLHRPGSQRPELFVNGLSREARVQWMLHLGFLIQGPPPIETRQRMAKAQSVPVEDLAFPSGGQIFKLGMRYLDLAENEIPTCFGEVEKQHYEAYFGQAIVFHATQMFPVLQLVWSDTRGRFPWDQQFERRFRDQQQILFHPQRYLPLKEAVTRKEYIYEEYEDGR